MIYDGALTGNAGGADASGFLRVLCHEFAPPIASVRALTRALVRPTPQLSGEQRAEALRLITDHAEHLAAMLDAVRVVTEHLPGSTAGARQVSSKMGELVSGAAHAAGLSQLDVRIAPVVEAVVIDVPSVRRIMTNLLENARKYGAEPIRVHAARHLQAVQILVIDNGPGMPPHIAASAFRHDTPVADTQHGLGLWIVTQLVTMLGGSVRAEPNDPTGTRIEVVLPLPE